MRKPISASSIHFSSVVDIEQAFHQSMVDAGIQPSRQVPADGQLHRFHVAGDKPGSRNGWAVLYADGMPSGVFGSWKTGIQRNWCALHRSQLSARDRVALDKKIRHRGETLERQQLTRQRTAAMQAQTRWHWADEADPGHSYLQSKQVPSLGLRQHGPTLLVPLTDGTALVNLQRISPSGNKRFMPGAKLKGCFAKIGQGEGTFYVCEGWATGATIHKLTGAVVICAMTVANLLPVAQRLRQIYPGRPLIIAGDNDRFTEGNPGKTQAQRVARITGAEWMVPDFRDDLPGTDYNDRYLLELEGRL